MTAHLDLFALRLLLLTALAAIVMRALPLLTCRMTDAHALLAPRRAQALSGRTEKGDTPAQRGASGRSVPGEDADIFSHRGKYSNTPSFFANRHFASPIRPLACGLRVLSRGMPGALSGPGRARAPIRTIDLRAGRLGSMSRFAGKPVPPARKPVRRQAGSAGLKAGYAGRPAEGGPWAAPKQARRAPFPSRPKGVFSEPAEKASSLSRAGRKGVFSEPAEKASFQSRPKGVFSEPAE